MCVPNLKILVHIHIKKQLFYYARVSSEWRSNFFLSLQECKSEQFSISLFSFFHPYFLQGLSIQKQFLFLHSTSFHHFYLTSCSSKYPHQRIRTFYSSVSLSSTEKALQKYRATLTAESQNAKAPNKKIYKKAKFLLQLLEIQLTHNDGAYALTCFWDTASLDLMAPHPQFDCCQGHLHFSYLSISKEKKDAKEVYKRCY